MKAVILAGGMGTRLRPVTGDGPKPMVPLLGKPLMEHIIALLRAQGFTEICAAVRYRAGDIMAHFGDGSRFGVHMQYRLEQEALGTRATDIGIYVRESMTRMVTGEMDIESSWDDFQKNLETMGLETVLTLAQAAWDRANG